MNFKSIGCLCANDPVSVSLEFKRRFESFIHNVQTRWTNRQDHTLPCACWIPSSWCSVKYGSKIHPLLEETQMKKLYNPSMTMSVSVPSSNWSPPLHDQVTRFQMHICNASCMRLVKDKKKNFIKRCRHGFPRKISDKTTLISKRWTLCYKVIQFETIRKTNLKRSEKQT